MPAPVKSQGGCPGHSGRIAIGAHGDGAGADAARMPQPASAAASAACTSGVGDAWPGELPGHMHSTAAMRSAAAGPHRSPPPRPIPPLPAFPSQRGRANCRASCTVLPPCISPLREPTDAIPPPPLTAFPGQDGVRGCGGFAPAAHGMKSRPTRRSIPVHVSCRPAQAGRQGEGGAGGIRAREGGGEGTTQGREPLQTAADYAGLFCRGPPSSDDPPATPPPHPIPRGQRRQGGIVSEDPLLSLAAPLAVRPPPPSRAPARLPAPPTPPASGPPGRARAGERADCTRADRGRTCVPAVPLERSLPPAIPGPGLGHTPAPATLPCPYATMRQDGASGRRCVCVRV